MITLFYYQHFSGSLRSTETRKLLLLFLLLSVLEFGKRWTHTNLQLVSVRLVSLCFKLHHFEMRLCGLRGFFSFIQSHTICIIYHVMFFSALPERHRRLARGVETHNVPLNHSLVGK